MTAYLAIISGAIKLFNYVAAALQQHHDELNGANAQKLADTQGVLANVDEANRATDDSALDKLVRDKYGR